MFTCITYHFYLRYYNTITTILLYYILYTIVVYIYTIYVTITLGNMKIISDENNVAMAAASGIGNINHII